VTNEAYGRFVAANGYQTRQWWSKRGWRAKEKGHWVEPRGIRHIVAWDASGLQANRTFPPPGLLLDPTFREGFACLQGYGLSFEAWQYHAQLPDLIDLAQTFPETTIILNHIGGPIGTGPYAAYRSYL
jgi:predicted TIM-barrel fold metal-dependent hydrolase